MDNEFISKWAETIKFDIINKPRHYNSSSIQPIDVTEDWELCFHLGNCVKYICRAGLKNKDTYIEDLKKARWYLDRKINNLIKKDNKSE